MKKEIKVLVMMALAIASLVLATSATKNPEIIRISKGDAVKTIDIRLANLQHRNTSVVVQDMEGKCWYSESIWNEDGYTKRLNLNGLPNGYYLCYVKSRNVSYTQSFRLSESDLVFLEFNGAGNPGTTFAVQTGSKRPALVRITGEKDKAIRLQLANLQEQKAVIRLNILGEGIACQEVVTGEQAFAKNINLNGMADGAYFLYVNIGGGSVIQFIDLSPAGVRLDALERLDKAPVKSAGLAHH